MNDGSKEEIVTVANLAKRCLNLNGRRRPTMKEVAVELEGIQLSVKGLGRVQGLAEVGYVPTDEITEAWDVDFESTRSCEVHRPMYNHHCFPIQCREQSYSCDNHVICSRISFNLLATESLSVCLMMEIFLA